MPTQRRPPMPKLPPFALGSGKPKRKRPYYFLIFFCVFALPLFAVHMGLLELPFFWDELGQFIPSTLDLLRDGSLVSHSAVPNVHPPGLEAYLALVYKCFGFSIATTRAAMMLLASVGLLVLFLLSIELSRGSKGAPAFLPPILLLASPLFFTQSMLAQLDMPAMVFSLSSSVRQETLCARGSRKRLSGPRERDRSRCSCCLWCHLPLSTRLEEGSLLHSTFVVFGFVATSASRENRSVAGRPWFRPLQRDVCSPSCPYFDVVEPPAILRLFRRVPVDWNYPSRRNASPR
jgi:hypothetical protein